LCAPAASGAACLNEINYLKNRKNFLGARRLRSRTPQPHRRSALYATTTIRQSLSRYRMAVRAALGESHPALRYLKPHLRRASQNAPRRQRANRALPDPLADPQLVLDAFARLRDDSYVCANLTNSPTHQRASP
jgi:hypothetical protein